MPPFLVDLVYHILVHFADCANKRVVTVQKGLLEEQLLYEKSFHKPNESGASTLTRTVCKALARGANEKMGNIVLMKQMGNIVSLTFMSKTSLREITCAHCNAAFQGK
jgi:hypothetical protein